MPPTQHKDTLNWIAPTGPDAAVGYNVYRATTSGGPFTLLNASPITALTFADTTGIGGTTYFYVVTAVDANGDESGFSNQASCTFESDPNAPTGLTAAAS
jgi:fibronectin type 3 domain-containing protein